MKVQPFFDSLLVLSLDQETNSTLIGLKCLEKDPEETKLEGHFYKVNDGSNRIRRIYLVLIGSHLFGYSVSSSSFESNHLILKN